MSALDLVQPPEEGWTEPERLFDGLGMIARTFEIGYAVLVSCLGV